MKVSHSFRSATISQEQLLPGIHGLRGIAALAVVLFHIVHLARLAVPEPFQFIASDFGKGVHLFFVLSAFSLMHSTNHTTPRTSWVTEYFIKRFFRIAPLFYCLLAAMVLWPVIKGQTVSVNWQTLLLNLSFTFGLAPWTGMVWAGWTVGVEMLFYAVLPVLMLTVHSSRATLGLAVVGIAVSMASGALLQAHYAHTMPLYKYNWAYFSFAPNFCYFALGMYAFRVAQEADRNSNGMRLGVAGLACLLLLLLFAARPLGWHPDIVLWGIAFAALTLWQSRWPSGWCANRMFEYVGERSYSVYLLHPVMIALLKSPIQSLYAMLQPQIGAYAFFLCTVFVLVPLLLMAELSYRLIEIPGIRYGRRINARIRAGQAEAA